MIPIQGREGRPQWPVALLVFAAVFALRWMLDASSLSLVGDEGIYLSGAKRILEGQAPYRDFFVLTGPGTYWLHAAILGVLGTDLNRARLLAIFDVASLAAATYWLAHRLAGRGTALAVAVFFAAFGTAYPRSLAASHRWDSATLAMGAVLAGLALLDRPRRALGLVAGVLAAWAAWTTPTLLTLTLVLALWMAWNADLRAFLPSYVAGIALASAAPLVALTAQGAVIPLIRHMLWSAGHYPVANHFTYGGIVGGYSDLFTNAGIAEIVLRSLVVFVLALPAVLPVVAFAGWPLRLRLRPLEPDTRRQVIFLLCSGSAVLASFYPRMEIGHLVYAAPIFYVLTAALLAPLLPRLAKTLLCAVLGFLGLIFLLNAYVGRRGERVLDTRIGRIRGPAAEVAVARAVSQRVQPTDTVFVVRYTPMIYFLTRASNPTRYSFLQPGMMGAEDESAVLADLNAHPAKWIFYEDIPPSTVLRVWPASDPRHLRFDAIEQFIQARYERVVDEDRGLGRYKLFRLRQ